MLETSKAASPIIVPPILPSPLSVELVSSFSKLALIIAVPHIVCYSEKEFISTTQHVLDHFQYRSQRIPISF